MNKDNQYQFQDPTFLTHAMVFISYMNIIITGISAITLMLNHKAFDYVVQFLPAFLALEMLFLLFWIYRITSNALSVNPKNIIISPWLAVGITLLPICNLYFLYFCIHDVWRVSKNPQSSRNERSSYLILWGLFFSVLSCFLLNINFHSFLTHTVYEHIIGGYIHDPMIWSIVKFSGDIANIIATFILIHIIKKIYTLQMSTYFGNRSLDIQSHSLQTEV